METGLTGRVALITGASRGLGLAIAHALSAEGAHVALVARDESALADAASALESTPGEVLTIAADITSADAVEAAVAAAKNWKDTLNVVVNNAGPPMRPGGIADHPDEVWASAFDTKALGMIRVSRAALSTLPDDGTGRIINISGATAETIIPNGVVTAVVNGAVQAFTSYLATEAAARNITVNAVCPGMMNTEGWRQRLAAMGKAQDKTAEEMQAGMTQGLGIRAGRWGEPGEIGEIVTFLASDRAAYVTGQSVLVDGGLVKSVG
jgi:NAD(P)-dependent dehydrogenase (short-subunit alcohol dehydrogenase family)